LFDLTLAKISTFLVIVDKGGEKSHEDKKLSCKGGERYSKGERNQKGREIKNMTLERDQLKLSTQVGGASS
jgi:hypothetical protein